MNATTTSRRRFRIGHGVLVGALLVAGVWAFANWSAGPPGPSGPNVLVIVMDTVRADRCSFNGYARPTTPRLAAFAEDAVVYRNAYVPGGWTAPTHASLFTGLRPENHGLVFGNRIYLDEGRDTLAELLAGAGWSTALITGNIVVSPDFGMGQGFGHFEKILEPPRPRAADAHARALRFMKQARDAGTPFFVFVNDFQPHVAYAPPKEFESKFVGPDVPREIVARERGDDRVRSIRYLFDASEIPPPVMRVRSDLYDAEIASLDDAIGDLLSEMHATGLLDDTIVVITSDHGEHFGERGYVEHIASLYRPILHVPLIVRGPGEFSGGRIVENVVRLEDLFPTILEACGLAVPVGLDGESLIGLDPSARRVARAYYGPQTLATFQAQMPDVPLDRLAHVTRSVLDERWHLVTSTDGREQLFDVRADPLETTNLAPTNRDVVRRLRALLPVTR